MRTLKLCMAVGLILSLSGAAWAVTVPTPDSGWVFLEMTDKTNGTSYAAGVTGTWTRSNPEDSFTGPGVLTPTKSPDAWDHDPDGTPNNGDEWTEDTWGVFGIMKMRQGDPDPNVLPTDVGPLIGGNISYEWTSTADTGLVGMFYGGWDYEVQITDATLDAFIVKAHDVKFDLWAVDTSKLLANEGGSVTVDYEGPLFEADRRKAEDRYADWIDDADGTKVHLLHAESHSFVFSGDLLAGGNFQGTGEHYWDFDANYGDGSGTPGNPAWNYAWGVHVGQLTDANIGGLTDFFTDLDIDPTDTRDWMSSSSDDCGGWIIPEPLTVIGAFMGIGSLGAYIRKRRMA